MRAGRILPAAAVALLGAAASFSQTAAPQDAPSGTPEAVIDLGTAEGAALVRSQWRYSDARIVETDFPGPGADNQPTGPAGKTYDCAPHAGAADFDDSSWETISPESLGARRGHGRLSFAWYRITVTVPERIGGMATAGKTLVLETTLDDAAEVWVDGELTRYLGQKGGSVAAGWNAPNRLVVGRRVQPGQKISLAIFGINGPLSAPPTNYIYVRTARLELYPGDPAPIAITPAEVNVEVVRKDPAFDAIVGSNPKIWKLAEGFRFTEGPVWVPWERALFFSDPNSNILWKYSPDGPSLRVFRQPSGYAGADIAEYGQPGSNGLTLDPRGRLTIDQHGNRRVVRLEEDGVETIVAERYRGRRLNSPNDLVYRSDGTLYFTDPPFGLPRFFDDPRKELAFSGVYAVAPGGPARLLVSDLAGPNGIAFSPDERFLYVGNWDEKKKVVMRYPVRKDGGLGRGEVFFDMTSAPGEDAIDGIKVDEHGNLYVSGPGGLWVVSPAGKHLGTIIPPKHPHNFAWGDEDGRTLYLCARSGLYKMRLGISGVRPAAIGRVVRKDPRRSRRGGVVGAWRVLAPAGRDDRPGSGTGRIIAPMPPIDRRSLVAMGAAAFLQTRLARARPSTGSRKEVKTAGIRLIPVDGKYKVWTKRLGSGPIKMLTLHGGPGVTHEYFECFEDFLPQAGVEFYYYDQLGSFYSDQPDDKSLWTIDRFREEVEQVRAALGLENFYLYGQSWGSMLAIEYALKYQRHLKGLVLSSMTASIASYMAYIAKLRAALPREVLATLEKYEAMGQFDAPEYQEAMFKEVYGRHVCRLDPWPDPVARAFKHINNQVYGTMQGPNEFVVTGTFKDWDRWSDLPKITVPTLVVGARYDEMNPDDIRKMGRLLPRARVAICDEGSHLAMWDDQEAYFRALIPFLHDVEKGRFRGSGRSTPS